MRHLPNTRSSQLGLNRRAVFCLAMAGAAAALGCAQPARAVGSAIDLNIIDRDTGQPLTVYHANGRSHVAGRPGARYAIRVTNRSGERVLAVISVDGVNIVTGQTAAWHQPGYVLDAWQTHDLAGWRKSDFEVAAFEFTALPDSYAARTERPLDVGVIGVALFREKPRYMPKPTPPVSILQGQGAAGPAAADTPQAAAAPAPAEPLVAKSARRAESGMSAAEARADTSREKLGTGHGARETSYTSRTSFERASRHPAEIVSIQYDRHENLAAAGIIPSPVYAQPRPFPGPRPALGYVPDPPQMR